MHRPPDKADARRDRRSRQVQAPLLDREDDRLQVITVAELFDCPGQPGKRLDLPMARADAVKSAAALGDAGKQEKLL